MTGLDVEPAAISLSILFALLAECNRVTMVSSPWIRVLVLDGVIQKCLVLVGSRVGEPTTVGIVTTHVRCRWEADHGCALQASQQMTLGRTRSSISNRISRSEEKSG
ncbi:hypothetical protein EDD15DRAFT_1028001 [Pisolithus albus]|nr:hypothetical protein EDD15DRAFT_1028001 [Pisolithus albus]